MHPHPWHEPDNIQIELSALARLDDTGFRKVLPLPYERK